LSFYRYVILTRLGVKKIMKKNVSNSTSPESLVSNRTNLELISTHITRRNFTFLTTSLLFYAALPVGVGHSKDKLRVIWHGLSFMGKCNDDCDNLDKAFPNIRKLLKNEDDARNIWNPISDKIKSLNSSLPIEVVIPGRSPEAVNPDVGMVLAITSEADIASQYYPNDDVTFLIYEIQCYGIVFEFKKMRVMNSFPIRLWRTDKISGRKNKGSLKTWFYRALSGENITDEATLPNIFENKLKKIDFKKSDPVNIRVTKVNIRKMMQNWLLKQNKATTELERLAGNSLTSAISETVNIGVQPFSLNRSLADMAVTLATSGAGMEVFESLLNLPDPELDIRLALRGVKLRVKNTNKKYFKNYRITIGVEITIAKYKYIFEETGGVKTLISETLIKPILKQKLRAISIEETTEQWRNDWYWVLDLHHALFEWFFISIMDPDKTSKMLKGMQRKGKTRKFFFQVHSKNEELFMDEASQLREGLKT
jgi:hypothetical protein